MDGGERAFLSIIAWPEELSVDQRVRSLVAASGIEPDTARLRAVWPTPCVVQTIDELIRDAVLAPLRAEGVASIAPSIGELQAVGAPLLVREMNLVEDGYHFTLWRSSIETTVSIEHLQLVIRATIKQTERGIERGVGNTRRVGSPGRSMREVAAGGPEARRQTRTTTSDKIELQFRDGTRFRIDGDKFGWRVLGRNRGFSDQENATRLALQIAQDAPNAIVDMSFSTFMCPIEFSRPFQKGHQGVLHDPRFEGYCRWLGLIYQAVRSGAADR